MQYRKLGRTDLDVSVVGMGGIYIIGLSNLDAVRLILKAGELGVNFIETGRSYRGSESRFGLVMMKKRNEFHIASKTPLRTMNEALKAIDESLVTLKTDYIDIYQLHEVDNEDDLNKTMGHNGALEALKKAQKQGKIGFIGITGHSPSVLVKAIKTGEFDTVQVLLNLVEREALKELIPLAENMNVGIIGMKPFGGGAFLEKGNRISEILNQDTHQLVETFMKFCLSYGTSTVLTGVKTIEELEQNVSIGNSFIPYSDEALEKLISITESIKGNGEFCHRCGYCLPCPQNIDIPLIMRLNEYSSKFDSNDWTKSLYKHIQKADRCIECGICEEKCPFKLPVREILKEAHRRLGASAHTFY